MSTKPFPRPHPATPRAGDDLPDLLLTWFIQVTGLAAALIFGVFAILSWVDSQHAKQQAQTSNLIAIAAICAQSDNAYNNEAMQAICGPFFSSAWPDLSAAVGGLLPYVPTRTSLTAAPTSTSSLPASSSSFPTPGSPSGSSGAGFSGAPSSTALGTSVAPSSTQFSIPQGGTSATQTAKPSGHTVGAVPGAGGGVAALSTTGQMIGLGVGLGVGIITIVVSSLTCWKMRRRSRDRMYEAVDGRPDGNWDVPVSRPGMLM